MGKWLCPTQPPHQTICQHHQSFPLQDRETCLSSSPLINDEVIIFPKVMTNFLFDGFLPDQSIRLFLPRAAIEALHPIERRREAQEGTRGTCPQGLTDASCCGVWCKSGLTSILSAAPASSSAILRETDACRGRPPAGDERKPVASPRDEGRHFYDGLWIRIWRRIEQRFPVPFPEASVSGGRARRFSFPNFWVVGVGGCRPYICFRC